jgi:DNA-binding transcriptional MerR regulator
MRIGDLASKAGVTPRTIRYYESLGLLRSNRAGSSYRQYDEAELARLRKIDALKRLGLSLGEIASVIELHSQDPSGVRGKRKVLGILDAQLRETEEKITALEQFRSELKASIERMQAGGAEASVKRSHPRE